MDNSQNPIEALINSGLAKHFYRVFGVPLLFYNGPDVKTVAAERLKKKGLPSYPYAIARTAGYVRSQNGYKPNTLLRRGLYGGLSQDHKLTYQLNMIPVTTTFEIVMYVQDFPTVRKWGKQWLMSSTRNDLNFSITYGVADVDIRVQLDENVNVPPREGGATEVKEYQLQSNLMVQGYMSDPLKRAQVVDALEVQLDVVRDLGLKGGTVTLMTSFVEYTVPTVVEVPVKVYITDATYEHDQTVASSAWVISHNLAKYPSVSVVDALGNQVLASVNYVNNNVLIVTFGSAFAGKAYLN
jgi:hypothetical protein